MTDSKSPQFDPAQDEIGHEPLAVSIRGVVIAMVSLAALLVFTLVLANLLIQTTTPESTVSDSVTPSWNADRLPPAPRVTPKQAREFREMLAQQKAQLGETVLRDSKNNIAQIPLDRAIELLESEGLDAFDRLTGSDSNPGSNSTDKESEN